MMDNSKANYFDYMATTPVDPRICKAMQGWLTANFHNPHSLYPEAKNLQEQLLSARKELAQMIHGDPEGVIWTSGATEANNLALIGAARAYQRQGRHIITTQTEHASVLSCCRHLQTEDFEVTYLRGDDHGRVLPEHIAGALRPETILVSVMHANNETGIIQPIAAIAEYLQGKGCLFHVDASQSLGKIAIEVDGIDLLSCSAHKLYGPKGIGALYKRPGLQLEKLIWGGDQQQGIRSGTLPTHQILAFAMACQLAQQERDKNQAHLRHLRAHIIPALQAIEGLAFNVLTDDMLDNVINIYHANIDATTIEAMAPYMFSQASSCLAAKQSASHVLQALGYPHSRIKSSLRISWGQWTTLENAEAMCKKLAQVLV